MQKYKNTEFPHLHPSACEARIASPDELSAYIDKELPAWKRYLIQQHLKKCGTCAGHVQRLRKTDTFLRQGGEVETTPDFLAGVMARVSETPPHHQVSFWFRLARHAEPPFRWGKYASRVVSKLRQNIQMQSPMDIFALMLCIFTMVGVTFYSPHSDRFEQSAQAWKKSGTLHTEKLISFEVIRSEQPKRLLMPTLQQKSTE